MNDWIPTKTAAAILNLSKQRVCELVRNKRLESLGRFNNRDYYFDRTYIELEAQRRQQQKQKVG